MSILKQLGLSTTPKPPFPTPGISWKVFKNLVNTIFPSTFWIEKDLLPFPKPHNMNILVISKHDISCKR